MADSAKKKIKRLDPNGAAYRDAVVELALSFCPEIYPCKKCTHPVVSGYCCQTCGDTLPSKTWVEAREYNKMWKD